MADQEKSFVSGTLARARAMAEEFHAEGPVDGGDLGQRLISVKTPKTHKSRPGPSRISYKLPAPKVQRESRVKLTIELESELGEWFRSFCRVHGYQQREIIAGFLESLKKQNS